MAAISPNILVGVLLDAIGMSGGSGLYMPPTLQQHPREFAVEWHGKRISIWIYIWTITHGGRVTLPDEYRIQMTSVESPLEMNPDGYTTLMGYYPDLDVFGGFDLTRHRTFTTGSPSVQINLSALRDCLNNGMGFSMKDNQEIAIGIRPDQFMNYVINANQLHVHGANILGLLKKAANQEAIEYGELEQLPQKRQLLVSEVRRLSRDANFSKKVLNAYANRCAVTGMQLRLVEAAHILPVAVEGSSDETKNGISLSPTFHRAYDRALIYLDDDLHIRLNNEQAEKLKEANLANGLPDFVSLLNRKIILPVDKNQWPSQEYIAKANIIRRIPGC